jgi:GTP-binding protein EngB required for normal cell division
MSVKQSVTVATTSVRPAALRSYLRRKQRCAAAIQDALEQARARHCESLAHEYQDLLAKLAEDRFTLAVVGQFKRGKSSLMNAIMGKNILPTGVLPVTAVVTILRYGVRDRFMVQRAREFMPGEVPLSDLASYITHDGNPDNVKSIKRAILESPAPFLKHDFEFVDTPGVGSASDASTAATYEFLGHCDAVLFVTAVEGPMNTVESNLLRAVRDAGASSIVVVVNKIDLLGAHERDALLCAVRRHAASVLNLEPVVFSVSAQAALAAPANGDMEDVSGLASLQSYLSAFLSDQRAESFLASVENKFRAILASEPKQLNTADTIDSHVIATPMCSSVQTNQGDGSEKGRRGRASVGLSLSSATIEQPLPEGIAGFLAGRGCPACAYLVRKSLDCFAHLQYELSVDQRSQLDFASRSGFCPLHMWSLAGFAGPEGASRTLPSLADRLARLLDALSRRPDLAEMRLCGLMIGSKDCAFCDFLRRCENAFLEGLRVFLQSPSGRRAYDNSQGVCLKHLTLLIRTSQSEELTGHLLRQTASRCGVLRDDMRSFILKRTALRRDRLNGDEEDAFRRFLVFMACDKLIVAPPSAR